VLIKVN